MGFEFGGFWLLLAGSGCCWRALVSVARFRWILVGSNGIWLALVVRSGGFL